MKIFNNRTVKAALFIIIITIFFLILHFFARRFIFNPLISEKQEASKMQDELDKKQQLIRSVPHPQEELKKINNRIEDLRKKTVSPKELPRIIQYLAKKSSELKMQIISIKPIEELPFEEQSLPSGIKKVYIEIVAKAPFKTIAEYVYKLKELPVIFTLESILFTKPETEVEEGKKKTDKNIIASMIVSSYSASYF